MRLHVEAFDRVLTPAELTPIQRMVKWIYANPNSFAPRVPEPIPLDSKRCAMCERVLPLSAFGVDRGVVRKCCARCRAKSTRNYRARKRKGRR